MNAAENVAAPRWTSWAEQELGGAGLGDARLDRRLVKLTAALLASPQGSIPKACGNWAASKAAYRFFDNLRVDFNVVIERHRTSALLRAKEEPVVLAIADTTMLDYTDHPETAGLGPLADVVHHGLLLHPTLLVTPERVPIGVIDPQMWVRDIDTFGTGKSSKKTRSLDEKESQKWLLSAQDALRFQQDVGTTTHVVSVFDREGDTYDVLSWMALAPTKIDLLVRAKVDRKVDQEADRLWKVLENAKVALRVEITKPRKGKEEARPVVLSIRYATVTLLRPRDSAALSESVTVQAVFAREDDPPAKTEGIEWMLLTTVPVQSGEDAFRIVKWYTCRWSIEMLFKVLKSGCATEKRQLETADRLKRCLVLDLLVAWQILYLTTVGRDTPDLPCTAVFEEADWKALWVFVLKDPKALPKITPTLREMTRMIGRLGGHLGRKGDGEPGTVTLWRGLQRLPDIAAMWQIIETVLAGCERAE